MERLEEGQKGIAGFFSAKGQPPIEREKRKIKQDDDGLGKEEEGELEIVESTEPTKKKKRKIQDLEPNEAPLSPSPPPPPTTVTKKKERKRKLPTFTCQRCSRTLEIPASSLPAIVEAEYSQESIKQALQKVEDEERDYHLARDMVEEERKRAGWRTTSTSTKAKDSGKTKTTKKKSTSTSTSSSGKEKKEEGQRSLGSFFKK